MEILILGGTRFLGRALVDVAIDRGHSLTLFNRGRTNPNLYPKIEKLIGDRDGGVDILRGRRWDVVIDTCGYFPRVIKQSLDILKDNAGVYAFISSVSAYADLSQPVNENSPLATMQDDEVEEIIKDTTYGPLKVLCEQAVQSAFPGRALIIRPGYIVGPYDPSDRFTWWPHRVAQGGDMLCPGRPERVIQVIDVRDLADWTVRMMETSVAGVFNAVGPQITMGDLLSICQSTGGSDMSLTWVSESFIKEHVVNSWESFPIWVPESEPAYAGIHDVDASRALAHGLTCRALEHTVRATLMWDKTRPLDHKWSTGLVSEFESDLLQLWKKQL